jgi:hypothetical protein
MKSVNSKLSIISPCSYRANDNIDSNSSAIACEGQFDKVNKDDLKSIKATFMVSQPKQ